MNRIENDHEYLYDALVSIPRDNDTRVSKCRAQIYRHRTDKTLWAEFEENGETITEEVADESDLTPL